MYEIHNRNQYFLNVYNKYQCRVRIVYKGLTEEKAYQKEIERINELKKQDQAYCNLTEGGTGFASGKNNPIHKRVKRKDYVNPFSIMRFTGEKNHFYGRKHTEETKQKISQNRKGKGARFGKDNPMYGKGMVGKDNPMYGNRREKHPNVRMISVTYLDGSQEELTSKECERKFGIAYLRVKDSGEVLRYKKKSKNDIYEGTTISLD